MFKGKWYRVYEMLKKHGLNKEGALELDSELDTARAYGYEHNAIAAHNAILQVYKEEK